MATLVSWVKSATEPGAWELRVVGRRNSAATVWSNGVWHTWDRHGTGGENSREATVDEAKTIAAGRAVAQGFI